MFVILLAELLDRLSVDGAFVRESENDVSASGLAVGAATNVIAICKELGWEFNLFDSAGTEWPDGDLLQDFAPYRLRLRKPSTIGDTLELLTNTGFAEWLRVGHSATNWKVARLRQPIFTHARMLQPWGEAEPFQPSPPTKSPRSLVREFGPERAAPEDVQPWLLRDEANVLINDEATKVWVNASVCALLNSLADEIDPADSKLKFKGPPKLSISLPDERDNLADQIGIDHFNDLQRAANWVFENEREAELRHNLLANDIARSAGGNSADFQYLFSNISASLDGAKVAYQVSLSDLGRDTLKMLADLRKAVTEETAKVTDATRQLVTSVAGALAISLGLIAVRVNAAASYELIVAVMIVVAAYVGVIIYSGYGFIQLQRQLRSDWQPRLYRFLPLSEYESMVSKPANQSERTFFRVAWGGGIGIAALTAIVIFGWWDNSTKNKVIDSSTTTQSSEASQGAKAISQSLATNSEAIINIESKVVPDESVGSTSVEIAELDAQPKDTTTSKKGESNEYHP
ncbi:hypothetical protein MMZ75_07705 [Pseudomonas aeruginosa]|uniref:hypothetical protein n=1 Tax=Pseudomonas aeruginosa TaxID=287 RepID=UPI000F53DFBA|nr:hypothetical protein [Pseudomonas aeruginosa]MCO3284213.1 hypothetical protein [Pseudomonas aeruginosa]UTN34077.1 hypothetical protein MMZ75_07705 [Pseudomonas aeruginosa]